MMNIFLAVPYSAACGLNGAGSFHERVSELIRHFEQRGFSVYAAPREESWGRDRPTRERGIVRDIAALAAASVFVAMFGGYYADGVLVEIGMALSMRKRVILLRAANEGWPKYLDGLVAAGLAEAKEYVSEADLALVVPMPCAQGPRNKEHRGESVVS